MTELEKDTLMLQKMIPLDLVKFSSAKAVYISLSKLWLHWTIYRTLDMFFWSHLSTFEQWNAQFGNSGKQLVMEKFSVTKILCQSPSHEQNVSTVPLQLSSTHHQGLRSLPRTSVLSLFFKWLRQLCPSQFKPPPWQPMCWSITDKRKMETLLHKVRHSLYTKCQDTNSLWPVTGKQVYFHTEHKLYIHSRMQRSTKYRTVCIMVLTLKFHYSLIINLNIHITVAAYTLKKNEQNSSNLFPHS